MTPLAAHIAAQIRQSGPITLADYVALCLTHPEHGYYTGRDPLGASGDFTTAPEISQMFGELIGLALAQVWREMGAPRGVVLAEPGPGRGTLMADILRATRGVPGFHGAVSVHLVEISEVLRTRQREVLAGHDVTWHDTVADLPDGPLLLVANEFFDALPVRQFVRRGDGWAECVIGLTGSELRLGRAPSGPVPALSHRIADTKDGDIVELCPAAASLAGHLAGRIAAAGGSALIVDYGDWRSQGDTLQAVSDHEPVDILTAPGETDLTAHVDFEPIARAARDAGAATSRLTPQGVFLERLGITARAETLARRLAGPALQSHIAAHRRLTHPGEMGNLYKVMSIHPADAAPPPGLEA